MKYYIRNDEFIKQEIKLNWIMKMEFNRGSIHSELKHTCTCKPQ